MMKIVSHRFDTERRSRIITQASLATSGNRVPSRNPVQRRNPNNSHGLGAVTASKRKRMKQNTIKMCLSFSTQTTSSGWENVIRNWMQMSNDHNSSWGMSLRGNLQHSSAALEGKSRSNGMVRSVRMNDFDISSWINEPIAMTMQDRGWFEFAMNQGPRKALITGVTLKRRNLPSVINKVETHPAKLLFLLFHCNDSSFCCHMFRFNLCNSLRRWESGDNQPMDLIGG
jgi:hypothetical protein